jgi:acyl-homoserine lactone acylase PvdQ
LPHVINPPSGFVQNCNSNPWGTTEGPGNPDPAKYPSYIVRDPDTARAKNSRRILSGNQKFSYDDLSRLSFDTELFTARLRVPKIVAAVTADSDTAAKYGEPLAALRAWDFRGGVDSVPSTLYIETEMAAGGDGWRVQMNEDPPSLRRAFTQVVDRLEGRWGTWQVPWGKVNRLQRQQPFSKEHPSWPVPGANSSFGQIFAFTGPPQDGVRYGTGGNTYVALVEFGPRPRASAVCGFGQSADPQSPHFLDQAPLYAAGQYRPAWFDWDDVKKNAERSYHPGD